MKSNFKNLEMRPVVAIVQARMSSTRLPGKVLADVAGRPVLWHVLNRLKRVENLDGIVVATSTDGSDDAIERWCNGAGVPCFRGSLDDVLKRYAEAARSFGASTVVRITADCPLLEPRLVDRIIETFLRGGYDHYSVGGTFPDGCDAEVFSVEALSRAEREARLPSEREHVTPYIWKNTDKFRTGSIDSSIDLSDMRWTVDDPRDLEFVRAVYGAMGPSDGLFTMGEVVRLLERRPEIAGMNAGTMRNEGYAKSLREDSFVSEKTVNA